MSELMDQAVIGMPYEMAMESELSRRQFYSRAQSILAQTQALREEVAALRARVVVPDGYALVPIELTRDMWVAVNKEDDRAYAGACDHGAQFDWLWEAAIEAAPHINGKAVSEGLLRRIVEEQPAVQDIGEMFNWQYARDQAMAELRALLGEVNEHE